VNFTTDGACQRIPFQLAGGNKRAYIASIKDRFNLGEVILGEFLDAFNAAEQARQKRIEADRLEAATAQKIARDEVDAAQKWMKEVLGPVTVDLHNDLKPVGNVGIADTSRPPIVARNITIALNGYQPKTLGFHIERGAITVFIDGRPTDTIGSITSTNAVRVKELFRKTVATIADT
jgi:hypothetical protein